MSLGGAIDAADPMSWMTSGYAGITTRQDISVFQLTSGASTTDGTSIATSSITPTAGRFLVAWLTQTEGDLGDTVIPTVAGCGLTWVAVTDGSQSIASGRRITAFYAIATTPSAGAVTFTFAGAGSNQDSFIWSIAEYAGVDVVNPIVQAKPQLNGVATTATLTLTAPLENAKNVMVVGVCNPFEAAITHDPLFAELSDSSVASYAAGMNVQWAVNKTSCTPSWTSGATAMVGIEIKAA